MPHPPRRISPSFVLLTKLRPPPALFPVFPFISFGRSKLFVRALGPARFQRGLPKAIFSPLFSSSFGLLFLLLFCSLRRYVESHLPPVTSSYFISGIFVCHAGSNVSSLLLLPCRVAHFFFFSRIDGFEECLHDVKKETLLDQRRSSRKRRAELWAVMIYGSILCSWLGQSTTMLSSHASVNLVPKINWL